MIKYFSILLLCLPLLASATVTSNYDSSTLQTRINTIQSGKSNHADRKYWHHLLKWSDRCESAFQSSPELHSLQDNNSGLKIYPAQNKNYIIRITCALGIYQGYQQFYHVSLSDDKVGVKPLVFPIYEMTNSKQVLKTLSGEVWGNVLKTSDYKNLTIVNLYSGYGNCGSSTTYQIINADVSAIKFLTQPDCKLKRASRDPKQWPEYPIPN